MIHVYINGIEYKATNKFSLTEKAGNKTASKISVLVEHQDFPASGDVIEMQDDSNGARLFYGTCGIPSSPKYTSVNGPKEYGITCGNGNSIMGNRIANVAYQGKRIDEIILLLFTQYISAENITLGTISNIPLILQIYTASNYGLNLALDELANMVNAVWEITPDRVFNFIVWDDFPALPRQINSQFLLGTELQHKTRSYNLRTVQIVAGATDNTDPQYEGWAYDGEMTTFDTVFPIAEKPQLWVNGIEVPPEKIGVRGFDDSNDNIVFLFSFNSNSIGYVERTEFLQTGDSVTIQYIGIFSIRVVVSNAEKITEIADKTGTSGIIERVQIANSVRSTADAVSLGLSLLSQFEEKEGEVKFWLTSEQLSSLGMELADTGLLTMFDFDLPEIGIVGKYVVNERTIEPLIVIDNQQDYKISLTLADRNVLKSYGQIVRDIEHDVAQLTIRPEEIVVQSQLISERFTMREMIIPAFDIAYYAGSGIYEGSRVAPIDFGLMTYAQ